MVRDYYVKKLKNVSFSVLNVLCGTSDSNAYLKPCQVSVIELFFEDSQRLC